MEQQFQYDDHSDAYWSEFKPPTTNKALDDQMAEKVFDTFCDILVKNRKNQVEVDLILTRKEAMIIVAIMLQCGGSIENQPGSSLFSVTYRGTKYSLGLLDAALAAQGAAGKRREFGFAYANDIHAISCKKRLAGFLWPHLLGSIENVEEDDRFWCSDVQAENPNCPSRVRNALLQHRLKRNQGKGPKGSRKGSIRRPSVGQRGSNKPSQKKTGK